MMQRLKWLVRNFRYFTRFILPQQILLSSLPNEVLSGPFKGMKYSNTSVGSTILPKIIGSYEDELHPILEKLKNEEYDLFLDVGAAEGYYVVGIKKYLLQSVKKVIAFEEKSKGRNLIAKLCKLNGVDNVKIEGYCDTKSLSSALQNGKCFILMDIEGGEHELLDPEKIDFSNSDILVEMHLLNGVDFEVDMREKFINTHTIIVIEQGEKTLPKEHHWNFLVRSYANFVVDEIRASSRNWLFLKSKVVKS